MILSAQAIARINLRLKVLLPQYKKAIQDQNLIFAQNLIVDINPLLKQLNKTTQLVELKNALFELAMIQGQPKYAIEGLLINQKFVNKKTRLHLEGSALLAIAYLRLNDLISAKPFIIEVLKNKNIIKSETTRRKFNKEIIERFDEEAALYSLRNGIPLTYNLDEIHSLVLRAIETKTNNELYIEMGLSLPKATKDILFQVDEFSKKQLTFDERKLLPSPVDLISNDEAGRTVFSAFKRVVYKSVCDPNSEVYKGWYTNGVGSILDKKFITGAVVAKLSGYGIGSIALIIAAVALLIRFGLDIYCERFKPVGVTELRRKGD